MPKRAHSDSDGEQPIKAQLGKNGLRKIRSASSERSLQLLYQGISNYSKKSDAVIMENGNACFFCKNLMICTKCNYCEKRLCTSCANECKMCLEEFCKDCSHSLYEGPFERLCFSCYK